MTEREMIEVSRRQFAVAVGSAGVVGQWDPLDWVFGDNDQVPSGFAFLDENGDVIAESPQTVQLTKNIAGTKTEDGIELNAGLGERITRQGRTALIYKQSGKVYAEGPSGIIDYGSDAATIIQSAVDHVSKTGGEIIIERGTYSIASTITITADNVSVTGHGWSTVLKAASGLDADVIRVGGGTTERWNVNFENFSIAGNGANQTAGSGIHLDTESWYCRVEDVEVDDAYADGIRITSTSNLFSVWHVIYGCKLSNNGQDGVNLVGSKARDNFINNCAIRKNTRHGVNADTMGQNYNHIYQNGILANEGTGVLIGGKYCSVNGNHYEFNRKGGTKVTGKYSSVMGNTHRENSKASAGTYDEILMNGSYCSCVGNSGYVPNSNYAVNKSAGDYDSIGLNTMEGSGYPTFPTNTQSGLNT